MGRRSPLKQAILRELKNPTGGAAPGVQIPEVLNADPILATEVREPPGVR